ncbi:transglutaminase-like cysteine peptidase [soil metagenome]
MRALPFVAWLWLGMGLVGRAWCRPAPWIALALLTAFVPLAQAWRADQLMRAAQSRSPQALAGARALDAMIVALDAADDAAKITAVNQFFNRRITYAEDSDVWGEIDYWASPLELLEKGRGDCEDYVIAKYFSLVALGMPTAKLRLVYVRARLPGPRGAVLAHMVLAYYQAPGMEPLILDNLIGEVKPASARGDLEPVFSFNSDGLWQGTGSQSAGDPVARLSKWRDVLAKARAEGFER